MTPADVKRACPACQCETDDDMTRDGCVLYGMLQVYRAVNGTGEMTLCQHHGQVLQTMGIPMSFEACEPVAATERPS
jgi:hypothetical protein